MGKRIAFMDALVLAIAAGEKDVTRRMTDPRLKPGDVVDVCEALTPKADGQRELVAYRCDGAHVYVPDADGFLTARPFWPWKVRVLPARYCPGWAVRTRIEVMSVRPELLTAITDDDARREGLKRDILGLWGLDIARDHKLLRETPRDAFLDGFRAIHGLPSDADPTVFRIEFRRAEVARG